MAAATPLQKALDSGSRPLRGLARMTMDNLEESQQ
jgi:hypothetical protein